MSALSILVLVALGVLLAVRAVQSLVVVRGIFRLPTGAVLERVDRAPVLGSTLSHKPLTVVLFVPDQAATEAALETIRSVEATRYPALEILVLAERPNDLLGIREHFELDHVDPVIVNADSGRRYEQWTAATPARLRLIRGPFRNTESLALSFASWGALFPLLLWLSPGVLVSRSMMLRLGATLEHDRRVGAVVGGVSCSRRADLLARLRCWLSQLRRLELYGLSDEACALGSPASVVLFRRSALVDAEAFDRGKDTSVLDVLGRLVEGRRLAGEGRLAAAPYARGRWSSCKPGGVIEPDAFESRASAGRSSTPSDWNRGARLYVGLRTSWLHRFELLTAGLVLLAAVAGSLPTSGALVAAVLLLLLPALLGVLTLVWDRLTLGAPEEELVESLARD